MSLLTTSTLILLYNAANATGAMETATMAFWTHYFTKHIFTDETWVVTQEQPPSGTGDLRRVDTKIQFSTGFELKLIAICEAKRARSTPTAVEAQLVEACEAAGRGTGICPYGIAILGTSVKFFQWDAGKWLEITPSYDDANSQVNGPRILQAFMAIKNSVRHSTAQQASYGAAQGQVGYGGSSAQAPAQSSRPKPAGDGWYLHTQGRWYRYAPGGKIEWD